MNTITKAMSAVSCVASARPRQVNQSRVADLRAQGRGTSVSIFGFKGLRAAVVDAPAMGHVSDFATTYPTTDVARFRSGRPPV